MRNALVCLLVLLVGLQPAVLQAEQAPPAQPATAPAASPPAAPGSGQDAPQVQPALFDASFERVRRALAMQPASTAPSPLKLDFYVEVVGQAPPIQLFTPQDLIGGPVPGGPPTHQEMLGVMTPQEFRSPAMPISTLAIMGIQQLIKWQVERHKKQVAEEKRKKEEEERKRLLYGTALQPPK